MPAFLNTLGSVPRRGQWRFRQVLRARRSDGRTDLSDGGLVDFGGVSDAVMTVTPRAPDGCGGREPAPALKASLADGSLRLLNPGIVEAVFAAGSLLAFPPGIFDVRLFLAIGPETAQVFDAPVEFA